MVTRTVPLAPYTEDGFFCTTAADAADVNTPIATRTATTDPTLPPRPFRASRSVAAPMPLSVISASLLLEGTRRYTLRSYASSLFCQCSPVAHRRKMRSNAHAETPIHVR